MMGQKKRTTNHFLPKPFRPMHQGRPSFLLSWVVASDHPHRRVCADFANGPGGRQRLAKVAHTCPQPGMGCLRPLRPSRAHASTAHHCPGVRQAQNSRSTVISAERRKGARSRRVAAPVKLPHPRISMRRLAAQPSARTSPRLADFPRAVISSLCRRSACLGVCRRTRCPR